MFGFCDTDGHCKTKEPFRTARGQGIVYFPDCFSPRKVRKSKNALAVLFSSVHMNCNARDWIGAQFGVRVRESWPNSSFYPVAYLCSIPPCLRGPLQIVQFYLLHDGVVE